jgi:predicted unusual protein kinase regulating ubiquinone biosynthesis (AarF/ABC1/UbiB family)
MNLVNLFSSIIQYNLPFLSSESKKSCIGDIKKQFINGGCVWQKFAQLLSGHGEIIGDSLANELQSMCFDCPAHDDAYSARIIRDAFGDKYDTKHMKMIGSGTISQVYKIKVKEPEGNDEFVAIKVMHPNIKKEIISALDKYTAVKDSYLFPQQLRLITNLFFNGLREQLDMKREFKNGKTVKRLLQANTIGNYALIIPEMIAFSKKCLVMSYEESTICANIDINNYDKHAYINMCEIITFFLMTTTILGFIHMDLHMGNYGITKDMKIVIYDFGQMCDISNMTRSNRSEFVRHKINCNIDGIVHLCNYDIHKLKDVIHYNDFATDLESLVKHVIINNIQMPMEIKMILISWVKITGLVKNMFYIINLPGMEQYKNENLYKNGFHHYITMSFPYDEFKPLADIFVKTA